jgi:hypothetical protein
MPTRPVTLSYAGNPDGFGPNPKTVPAKPGDKIVFKNDPSNPANSKLRITLLGPDQVLDAGFSHRQVAHGPGQNGREDLSLDVKEGFSASVPYRCELLDANGNVLFRVEGGTGGEIMPDTGTGA